MIIYKTNGEVIQYHSLSNSQLEGTSHQKQQPKVEARTKITKDNVLFLQSLGLRVNS